MTRAPTTGIPPSGTTSRPSPKRALKRRAPAPADPPLGQAGEAAAQAGVEGGGHAPLVRGVAAPAPPHGPLVGAGGEHVRRHEDREEEQARRDELPLGGRLVAELVHPVEV